MLTNVDMLVLYAGLNNAILNSASVDDDVFGFLKAIKVAASTEQFDTIIAALEASKEHVNALGIVQLETAIEYARNL